MLFSFSGRLNKHVINHCAIASDFLTWIVQNSSEMDADTDSASKRRSDFYPAEDSTLTFCLASTSLDVHVDELEQTPVNFSLRESCNQSDMDGFSETIPSLVSEMDQGLQKCSSRFGGLCADRTSRVCRQSGRPFSLGLLLILTCAVLHTLTPCVSAKLKLGESFS